MKCPATAPAISNDIITTTIIAIIMIIKRW